MNFGKFSISLKVADLEKSKLFYEKLGFHKIGGDEAAGYLILTNDQIVIGIFNMIEKNILTFNPKWNEMGIEDQSMNDIRELEKNFQEKGIEIKESKIEGESGPGYMTLVDPDGNEILFDQHV